MSKPNLLFYANKLGPRNQPHFFVLTTIGNKGFGDDFCRNFGMDMQGLIMDLKMKYIILYVGKV